MNVKHYQKRRLLMKVLINKNCKNSKHSPVIYLVAHPPNNRGHRNLLNELLQEKKIE